MAKKRKRRGKQDPLGIPFHEAESPNWRFAGGLVAGCCLLYAFTLTFGFSPLDDHDLIGQRIQELRDLSKLSESFTNSVFTVAYYRPLLTLTFRLDAILGGGETWLFHATNVGWHALCMVLLYLSLLTFGLKGRTAALWAAIVAVHPVHVHAVAWIPGRNDLMQAALALGLWLTLFHWRWDPKRTGWLIGHFVLFILALLTKESAVLFPVLLLAGDWVVRGLRRKEAYIALLVGWVTIAAVYLHIRSGIVSDPSYPWSGKLIAYVLAETGKAFVIYFGKYFLPFNLGIMPYPQDQTHIFGIVALAAVSLGTLGGVRNWKLLVFGVLWLGLTLVLPTVTGALGTTTGGNMEHRLYLGCFGLVLALSQLRVSDRLPERSRQAVSIGVALLFVGITATRIPLYRTQLSYANAAIKNSPTSYFTWLIRGRVHKRENRPEEALADFEKAVALQPGAASIYLSIGLLYEGLNQPDNARDAYTRGINNDAGSLNGGRLALSRGSIYFKAFQQRRNPKDLANAMESYVIANKKWLQATAGAREFDKALYGIGLVHEQRREHQLALGYYQKAAALGDANAKGAIQRLQQRMK